MTWVIWITNALFLIWIIVGVSNRPSQDCVRDQYLSRHDCIAASDTGTAIGVGLVVLLWFMVFIVETVIWFMTRRREVVVVKEER